MPLPPVSILYVRRLARLFSQIVRGRLRSDNAKVNTKGWFDGILLVGREKNMIRIWLLCAEFAMHQMTIFDKRIGRIVLSNHPQQEYGRYKIEVNCNLRINWGELKVY